jgi:hypothetical protein
MPQDQPVTANLTADVVRNYELGNVAEFGIDANVCIFQGSPVIVDGVVAGLANVPETAAGAGTFVGFAIKRRDNRVGAIQFVGDAPGSGIAGALRIRVNKRGNVTLWVAGAPTLVGTLVYCAGSDNFTVTKPASGAAYVIGRINEFTQDAVTNSLTRCVVEFDALIADVLARETGGAVVAYYPASAAITNKEGTAFLTKAGVGAMTLAAPITGTDDGKILRIQSTTAQAHTVTTPANGLNGSVHIGTFGGAIGDNFILQAEGGTWLVLSKTNVTLS